MSAKFQPSLDLASREARYLRWWGTAKHEDGYDDAAHAKHLWDYDPEGRYAVRGRGVSWLSWLEKVSER